MLASNKLIFKLLTWRANEEVPHLRLLRKETTPLKASPKKAAVPHLETPSPRSTPNRLIPSRLTKRKQDNSWSRKKYSSSRLPKSSSKSTTKENVSPFPSLSAMIKTYTTPSCLTSSASSDKFYVCAK